MGAEDAHVLEIVTDVAPEFAQLLHCHAVRLGQNWHLHAKHALSCLIMKPSMSKIQST